jgi:branched-chain amino acid transport system substrate-binding protein
MTGYTLRALSRLNIYMILAAVVIAVLIGVAIIYQQMQARPAETIKIGFLGPLQTEYGDAGLKAVLLAVDEINRGGGIMGRMVEVVRYDDGNTPAQGVAGFKKLVEEDKVVAVFGIHASPVGLAILPEMARYKIPVFAMGSVSDVIDVNVSSNPGYRYWFRFNINASMHGLMVYYPAKAIASQLGLKKFGLLYDNAPWTAPVIDTVKKAIRSDGYEVVYEGTIDIGKTTSFVPQLAKARDSGVEILLVWNAYGDAKFLQRDYDDMKPPYILIQFDGVGMRPEQWNITGGKLSYQVFAFFVYGRGANVDPKLRSFYDSFKQKYGYDPLFYAPYIYDAVYAWKKAVEASRSFDGDSVANYLEKNGYDGISGKWIFTKGHSPLYGEGYITTMALQWLPGGKLVVIWPAKIADQQFLPPPWLKK